MQAGHDAGSVFEPCESIPDDREDA